MPGCPAQAASARSLLRCSPCFHALVEVLLQEVGAGGHLRRASGHLGLPGGTAGPLQALLLLVLLRLELAVLQDLAQQSRLEG